MTETTGNMYTTLSIASLGPATLTEKELYVHEHRPLVRQGRKTNEVGDIEGATFQSKYERFVNKPLYSSQDVPGSTPKQLIRPLNDQDLSRRPDYTLHVDDIEGTRFSIRNRILSTKRHVNPLEPDYQLPRCGIIEKYEPRFIRDAMEVNDIDGTKSGNSRLKKFAVRDPFKLDDIDGAKADFKSTIKQLLSQKPPKDLMSVSDLELRNKSFAMRTTRTTSNLDPKYFVNGLTVEDDPKYTKPKSLPRQINDSHLLKTADIPGATASWRDPDLPEIREIHNVTSVADIEGAQADTLKRCLFTLRHTNPLYPVYESLDGDLLEPLNKPFIPPQLISNPTLSSSAFKASNQLETQALGSSKSAQALNLSSKNSLVPFDWKAGASGNLSQRLSGRTSNEDVANSKSNNASKSFSSGLVYYQTSSPGTGKFQTSIVSQRAGSTLVGSTATGSSRLPLSSRKAAEDLKADIESVRMLK